MKRTIKTATITIVALLVIATVLTAGFFLLKSPFASENGGTFILSVNPEIRIDYDENGRVNSVSGNNKDGRALLEGLGSYEGLSCEDVITSLVTEIYKAGYFVEEADGSKRRVVLEIEPGSVIPDKDFVDRVKNDVTAAVNEFSAGSEVVTIDNSGADKGKISLDRAKEIALAHAGVTEARFDDAELDKEKGVVVYEIEFYADGFEYDYEIDAVSGNVLGSEKEFDD